MSIQPITIKRHIYEPNKYNFPKGNLIINPDMNNPREADQEEEQENNTIQEKLNVGNPPKKFDIAEYLKNISEQCMLRAYKTQSFPTIKFEVGQITQNANPISTTPNSVMTFTLPSEFDVNTAKKIIMHHCNNGVTLKDQSNNGTEYTVKLEQTECDTVDEAEQKARELNVEDEENYRRAILFDETPMFLKVVGYNSKYNKVEKTDQSDFPDDLDDSTQDSDYDDPEELQKNKYIAGILYGMHNGLEPNTLINGVPQFQIEKPALIENLDLETIALYGLSLRLNTVFGYDELSSIAVKKNRYQKIYNKLILQGHENKDVIKLIAKLDLAYQIYNSYGNNQDKFPLLKDIIGIENYIINYNNTYPINMQKLDEDITQKLREKSKSIYETFYPAYKKVSTHIMNKINQNEVAQLPDMDNSYLIPQNNNLLVNNNSIPFTPNLKNIFNYNNVGYMGQSQFNNSINYNSINQPKFFQNQNSNQGPVPVPASIITTTNIPQQTTITYNPNVQELADIDDAIITEAGQNFNNNANNQTTLVTPVITTANTETLNVAEPNNNLTYQNGNNATNDVNVVRSLNDIISDELNEYNNYQNIQTTTTATTIGTNNQNTDTSTIIPTEDNTTNSNYNYERDNSIAYNNQYMGANNNTTQNYNLGNTSPVVIDKNYL